MAIGGTIYNLLFKRSSTFFVTICVGVFVFERTVDGLSDYVFNNINKGKQWHDIKHLYEKKQEE